MIDPRLLRIHPADNVLTVIKPLAAGDVLTLEGLEVTVVAPLAIGHKVAARALALGEKVIKYGAPIGSAASAIAAGAHVHTHNLRSDYLPTWLREDHAELFERQRALETQAETAK